VHALPRPLAALILSLVVVAVCAPPASAQKLRQPSTGSALAQLVRQTNALPSSVASKKQKAKLKKAAAGARRGARKSPCTSVRQLATFRRVLRGIKVKKGRRNLRGNTRLRALGPASLAASRALLAGPQSRRSPSAQIVPKQRRRSTERGGAPIASLPGHAAPVSLTDTLARLTAFPICGLRRCRLARDPRVCWATSK
jgi:hypothetical protein